MPRATPRLRSIAERLMAAETQRNPASDPAAQDSFPATARLRPHLATLVGKGGVRALLARALALASAEVAWLHAAKVGPDGDFEGLDTLGGAPEPAELPEGHIVLLVKLLGLLVSFVGAGLTSRFTGEVWPEIPPEDRDFGEEHDREETK